MDSKLLIQKIAIISYAVLVVGLVMLSYFEVAFGIIAASYAVLGYRKFKKYKQKQLVAGVQS